MYISERLLKKTFTPTKTFDCLSNLCKVCNKGNPVPYVICVSPILSLHTDI